MTIECIGSSFLQELIQHFYFFLNANIIPYFKRLYSKVIKNLKENVKYSRFVRLTVKEFMNVAALTEAGKLGKFAH